MVINQKNNILSTFLMINIWFLILLVLEIQQSRGFDKKGLWKFDRGCAKNDFAVFKMVKRSNFLVVPDRSNSNADVARSSEVARIK